MLYSLAFPYNHNYVNLITFRLIALTEEILLKFLKTDSLANVSVLNLHGNGLTKLKHLAGMPNLKKLVISFNDLTRLDDVAHLVRKQCYFKFRSGGSGYSLTLMLLVANLAKTK